MGPRIESEQGKECETAEDIISHSSEDQADSKDHDRTSLEDNDTQQPISNILSSQLAGSNAAAEDKAGKDRVDNEDGSSDELNKRFRLQRLNSSSSSSEANTPSPILTPKRPTPSQDAHDTPASPKQPRLRSPNAFSVSVGLAKKHLSQPSVISETVHGRTRNAISMLRPLKPQETDLNQEQKMETGEGTIPSEEPSKAEDEAPKSPDVTAPVPGNKPPTPPLHRFPSWVSTRPICFAELFLHIYLTLFFIVVFRKAEYMLWLNLESGFQKRHVQIKQIKVRFLTSF